MNAAPAAKPSPSSALRLPSAALSLPEQLASDLRSGAAVRRFKHDVEAGMVGVNIGVAAPVAFFPFSGWKDSFLGDLHAHGTDAVDFYTRKKTITARYFSSGQGTGPYFVET